MSPLRPLLLLAPLLVGAGLVAGCGSPLASDSPSPGASPSQCRAARWPPAGQPIADGIVLVQVDADTIRVENHGTRDAWVEAPAAPVYAQVPCLGWVAEQADTSILSEVVAGGSTELWYALPDGWPPPYRAMVELVDRPGEASIGVAWVGLAIPNASATAQAPAPSPTTALEPVRVYFTLAAAGDPCTTVAATTRRVSGPVTPGLALEQLLAGPTAGEAAIGYTSFFGPATADAPLGVAVGADGTAEVWLRDFRAAFPEAPSACEASALLASLDATLAEFPEIRRARYSFAGDEAAFYDWLGLPPPD